MRPGSIESQSKFRGVRQRQISRVIAQEALFILDCPNPTASRLSIKLELWKTRLISVNNTFIVSQARSTYRSGAFSSPFHHITAEDSPTRPSPTSPPVHTPYFIRLVPTTSLLASQCSPICLSLELRAPPPSLTMPLGIILPSMVYVMLSPAAYQTDFGDCMPAGILARARGSPRDLARLSQTWHDYRFGRLPAHRIYPPY